MSRLARTSAQVSRRLFLLAWAFAFCILASAPADAQDCPPVRDIHTFIQTWNDAVIGPGSRSHTCTLRLLTPDARITGVIPGKDGRPTRTIESPAEFVGWYQQHPTEQFWERTLHSTITVYENVARVTRTYEVRDSATSPVKATGIEDFQLIFDGQEWKVFSLLWQDTVAGRPLPKSYLPAASKQ